jgi:hypothetical protein
MLITLTPITNMKKTLTKDQIQGLLLSAYGFVDRNEVIFKTDKYLLHSWEFKLESFTGSDYQILEFSYDNATFVDGVATFETHDGDTESFKVLVFARDYRL